MKKSIGVILLQLVILIQIQIFSQIKKLSVEDIYSNPEFYPEKLNEFHWFDKGNKFSYLKEEPGSFSTAIYQHDIATGEEKVLVSRNQLETADGDSLKISAYQWSPDNKYILFTGTIPARKLKTGGNFYIYDVLQEKIIYSVDSNEEQENVHFSPDSKHIGFVRDNNLFVLDINSGKERQLTIDGSEEILNGVFDWVYEEEFSIVNGWSWSPDSKSIAFWHVDQSKVPIFKITMYDSLYPEFRTTHYPTAGANNSLVKIGVVNISSGKIEWMDIGNDTNIYIPRIKFTANPEILSIQRLNRLQNKLDLLFDNINTGQSKIILTEKDSAWISVFDDLYFLKDGKRFVWSSERDGYKHFYLYDYNGTLINQITKGNWEVDKLLSVDEKNNKLYYLSHEKSPIFTDFCSINLDGTDEKYMFDNRGLS